MNTKQAAEILTPNSVRWEAFTEALNLAVQVNGCAGGYFPKAKPRKQWHRQAKRVMTEMGEIDIPGSLAYFEAHGGYCDCEILMNLTD